MAAIGSYLKTKVTNAYETTVELVKNSKNIVTGMANDALVSLIKDIVARMLYDKPKWSDQGNQIVQLLNTLYKNFRTGPKEYLRGEPADLRKKLEEFRKKISTLYPEATELAMVEERRARFLQYIQEDFSQFNDSEQQKLADLLTELYQLSGVKKLTPEVQEPGSKEGMAIEGIGQVSLQLRADGFLEIGLSETSKKYVELTNLFDEHQNREGGIISTALSRWGGAVPSADIREIYNVEDDISTIFKKIQQWLDTQWPGFSGKMGDYAIKQVAKGACSVLKQLHPNDAARQAIQGFITEFTNVNAEKKPKEALYTAVNKFINFCTNNPLYINNWQIPGTGAGLLDRKRFSRHDPERPFHRNLLRVRRLEQAHKKNPKDTPKTEREIFEENRQLFTHNNRHFLLMKFIWETFCSLPPPSEDFYCQLIDGATPGKAKSAFFKSLNNIPELGSVRCFFAHVLYYVLMPVAKFVVHLATDTLTDEIRYYIRQQKKRNFQDAENGFINFIERMLGDISGSYNDIVGLGLNKGTLDESLGKVLEKPSLFNNQTPETLQIKIANAALEKILVKTDFASMAYTFFDKKHIHTESTLSKVLWFPVQSMIFICKYATYLVLFPLAWLTRSLAGILGKHLIQKNNPAGLLVEASAAKIKEPNALTFAINQIMYNMLEDFIEQISNPEAKPLDNIPPMDKTKKKKLLNILRLFIQVLEKSGCHNFDDLKGLLSNNSTIKSWMDSAKNMGLESSQDVVAYFLLVGFRTFINEEQFERQLNNFMGAVNRSFEVGNPIDKKEFVELEEAIGEQLRYLRLLAITKVVEENFGQSGEALSQNTTKAVERIKTTTKAYVSEMLAHFDLVERTITKTKEHFRENIKSCSKKFKKQAEKIGKDLELIHSSVKNLLEESIEFQENQNDPKRLQETEQVLQSMRGKMAEKCSEIDELIGSIDTKTKAISYLQKTIIPTFGEKLAEFSKVVRDINREELILSDLVRLEGSLKDSDFSYLTAEYPKKEQKWREIALAYQQKLSDLISTMHVIALREKLSNLQNARSNAEYQQQLADAKGYFDTYIEHRKHDASPLIIQTFSELEKHKNAFDVNEVRTTLQKVKALPKQFGKEKENLQSTCQEILDKFTQQDQKFIQKSAKHNAEIKTIAETAKTQLTEFAAWTETLEVPPIYAFDILKDGPIKTFIISATASMTKGPTEQATRFLNKAPVGKHAINSILHSILKGDFANAN